MKTIIILLIFVAINTYSQNWVLYSEDDLFKEFYLPESVEKSNDGIFVEVVFISSVMFPDTETHTLLYFTNGSYTIIAGYEKNISTGKIKIIPGSNSYEPINPVMNKLYKLIN